MALDQASFATVTGGVFELNVANTGGGIYKRFDTALTLSGAAQRRGRGR